MRDLEAFLASRGLTQVEITPAEPTIEDTFIARLSAAEPEAAA